MKHVLLVGLGGCLGAVARYKLSGLVLHHSLDWRFPVAMFVVNVVGCLAAGILMGLAERYGLFSADARLFLFTGLLGGFTTFSAFGVETTFLLRRGDAWLALWYAMSSVACGVAVLWAGMAVLHSTRS